LRGSGQQHPLRAPLPLDAFALVLVFCVLGQPPVLIGELQNLAPSRRMGHLLGQAPVLIGADQPYLCIDVGFHVP